VGVQFNHTIIWCTDQRQSAAFLTGILGRPAAGHRSHFLVMPVDNGVLLDFAEADGEISPQHYAFLVGDEEFDAAYGRIREQSVAHWADPYQTQSGTVNRYGGGRGVYFEDPDGHLIELRTRPPVSGS
jgi:catechol 2,3-dioxygenase-like lactoylglutathione lyase family enzyme